MLLRRVVYTIVLTSKIILSAFANFRLYEHRGYKMVIIVSTMVYCVFYGGIAILMQQRLQQVFKTFTQLALKRGLPRSFP